MIVVTGAAGFIGSCLIRALNDAGYKDIIAVDDFSQADKEPNLDGKSIHVRIDRRQFLDRFEKEAKAVDFVFHIGAKTDTTLFDEDIFETLNVSYTKKMWEICKAHHIPLVCASSAATYGAGELGYKDDEALIPQLQPLNPYGWSKQVVDIWALKQTETPPRWYGLKFFNVYGPNEYHKARMASVIFHSFNQINQTGRVKLFRSHRPDFEDGKQLRDFVYVKDVCDVCLHLLQNQTTPSGIYNLGSGKARTFLDLVGNVFSSLNKTPLIDFIDIPTDIRDKYQYFTEADMRKLGAAGYTKPMTSLEKGVKDYVSNYLVGKRYW